MILKWKKQVYYCFPAELTSLLWLLRNAVRLQPAKHCSADCFWYFIDFLCADGFRQGQFYKRHRCMSESDGWFFCVVVFLHQFSGTVIPPRVSCWCWKGSREIWWQQIKPFVIICIANSFFPASLGVCVFIDLCFLSVVLHNYSTILLMFPPDWSLKGGDSW